MMTGIPLAIPSNKAADVKLISIDVFSRSEIESPLVIIFILFKVFFISKN